MGFNYRQKRKEFEQNWAKALKQYIAAGMTQEQITAMREFDEELFRQERVYENRINVGLPDLNILRFSVEEVYFQPLGRSPGGYAARHCPANHGAGSESPSPGLFRLHTGRNRREIAHETEHGFVPS